jgi:hypothetical protein
MSGWVWLPPFGQRVNVLGNDGEAGSLFLGAEIPDSWKR